LSQESVIGHGPFILLSRTSRKGIVLRIAGRNLW
jgi:hypothetical protein